MFDIGTMELAVIALLALIIIGPKDLPGVMRTVGHWVRKAQSLTREFRSSMEDMAREHDLEEARQALKSATSAGQDLRDSIDPTGILQDDPLADRPDNPSATKPGPSAKPTPPPEPSTKPATAADSASRAAEGNS